jgi:SAM-dependent methyltransferase
VKVEHTEDAHRTRTWHHSLEPEETVTVTGDNSAASESQFWENFYQQRSRIWTGQPNELLVSETRSLPPGRALDLGCGEGADAIWLAQRGWQVTAVDISPTALGRGASEANAAGVAERITWQLHDLSNSFPTGSYDLVCSLYLHSPLQTPELRHRILRMAAAAVIPDGVLVVIGHVGLPSSRHQHHPEPRFPTTEEVLAIVDPQADIWNIERSETIDRDLNSPDGQRNRGTDNVLTLRRTVQ